MGLLYTSSVALSHYSGGYESIQSAAAAVVWRLDGLKISYKSMCFSTRGILIAGVYTTFFVVFTKVREHSVDELRLLAGEG